MMNKQNRLLAEAAKQKQARELRRRTAIIGAWKHVVKIIRKQFPRRTRVQWPIADKENPNYNTGNDGSPTITVDGVNVSANICVNVMGWAWTLHDRPDAVIPLTLRIGSSNNNLPYRYFRTNKEGEFAWRNQGVNGDDSYIGQALRAAVNFVLLRNARQEREKERRAKDEDTRKRLLKKHPVLRDEASRGVHKTVELDNYGTLTLSVRRLRPQEWNKVCAFMEPYARTIEDKDEE